MCDLWLQLEHGHLIRQGAPTALPAEAAREIGP
jgi:hypothetical protein